MDPSAFGMAARANSFLDFWAMATCGMPRLSETTWLPPRARKKSGLGDGAGGEGGVGGEKLVGGTGEKEEDVGVWDAHTGQLIRSFRGARHEVWGMRLSHDKRLVAIVGETNVVTVKDVSSGKTIHTL